MTLESCLSDEPLLFWFASRFLPHYPPLYATLWEVTVEAMRTAEYMDWAVQMAQQQPSN